MNKKAMPRAFGGFTLIELLVVISIIGVLATLVLANFNAARERARDVTRKSDFDQIKKALRMYYNDNNLYPETSATGNKIKACGNPATTTFEWDSAFACNSMVYMKILPHDPSWQEATGTPEYSYQQATGAQDFCLWTSLENKSDAEIAKSKTRCATACTGVTFDSDDYVVCAD